MSWRFLLKELVKRNVDPMPYLHWRLLPEDEARARALPLNSAALADFVISRVDGDGACDDELRALVYQMFRVPTA